MSTPDQPLTAAQAESLTATSEPWLSCDDCFDRVDGYADALISGRGGLDEPLRVHLAGCPACHEEAESLISLAATDHGLSSEQVLDAFRGELRMSGDTQPVRKNPVARLFRGHRDPR